MARKKKFPQYDSQLTYWNGWLITDESGLTLLEIIDSNIVDLNYDEIDDLDAVCETVRHYPDMLLSKKFGERLLRKIVVLRKQAEKDKTYQNALNKISKAIRGDGRKRKSPGQFEELTEDIYYDIDWFMKHKGEIDSRPHSIEDKIYNLITRDTTSDKARDKRSKEVSKYVELYYAHNKIYKQLRERGLSDIEIESFLRNAARFVSEPYVRKTDTPDGRPLQYLKIQKGTWYMTGEELHEEFEQSEEDNLD